MDDKNDAILEGLAGLLQSQSDLRADVANLERGQTALRMELVETRSQIMDRLDRQQSKLEAMFEDVGVNWHNADRVERKVDNDREEIRSLTKIVSELTLKLRKVESRLATLEDKT